MSDCDTRAPRETADFVPTAEPVWGFVENGRFYAVPKRPLQVAGLSPPCRVTVYSGPRDIIECPPHLEPYLGYTGVDWTIKNDPVRALKDYQSQAAE